MKGYIDFDSRGFHREFSFTGLEYEQGLDVLPCAIGDEDYTGE